DANPAPDLGQVALHHRQAADGHLAPLGLEDPVEVQHQRRLAGTVGAQDRHALARPDLEVDAVERHPTVGVCEARAAHGHRRDVASTGHAATKAATANAHAASGSAAAHQSDAAARAPA